MFGSPRMGVSSESTSLLPDKPQMYHSEKFTIFNVRNLMLVLIASTLVIALVYTRDFERNGTFEDFEESVITESGYRACVEAIQNFEVINKLPGCVYLLNRDDDATTAKLFGMTTICSCQNSPVQLDHSYLLALGMIDGNGVSLISEVGTGEGVKIILHHGKIFDGATYTVDEMKMIKLESEVDNKGYPIDNKARSITITSESTRCENLQVFCYCFYIYYCNLFNHHLDYVDK